MFRMPEEIEQDLHALILSHTDEALVGELPRKQEEALAAIKQLCPEVLQVALESGRFPTVTARRLRNIDGECFAPRHLVSGGTPA